MQNTKGPLPSGSGLIISFADLRPRAGYCYDDVERAPRRVRKAFKKCFAAESPNINKTAFDQKLVEIFDAATSSLDKELVFDSALARRVMNSVSWTASMSPTGLAQVMGYFYRARLNYFDRMADPEYSKRHRRPSCVSAKAIDRLHIAAMAKTSVGERHVDADLTALLSLGSDISPFTQANEPIWVPCDSDDDAASEDGHWVYPNDDNGSGSDDADDADDDGGEDDSYYENDDDYEDDDEDDDEEDVNAELLS